jgi:hypothetical protein
MRIVFGLHWLSSGPMRGARRKTTGRRCRKMQHVPHPPSPHVQHHNRSQKNSEASTRQPASVGSPSGILDFNWLQKQEFVSNNLSATPCFLLSACPRQRAQIPERGKAALPSSQTSSRLNKKTHTLVGSPSGPTATTGATTSAAASAAGTTPCTRAGRSLFSAGRALAG